MASLGKYARDFALLTAGGLGAVAVLWLLGGESKRGLEPYYREVARQCFEESDFLIYVIGVCAGAVAIELAFRLTQRRLSKRWRQSIVIVALALVYGLLHLRFNLAGVAYAVGLQLVVGAVFAKSNRLGTIVAWHVAWELCVIAFVIGSVIFTDGVARTVTIYEYKLTQVNAGKITWAEGWGWVDHKHLACEQLLELTSKFAEDTDGPVEHTFYHGHMRHFLGRRLIQNHYRFELPNDATAEFRHAVAAAALWDSTMRHEAIQAAEPVLLGNPLSAFAFEDQSTILLSAYLTQPNSSPQIDIDQGASSIDRWLAEGEALCRKQVTNPEDVEPPDPDVRANLRQLTDRMDEAAAAVHFMFEVRS